MGRHVPAQRDARQRRGPRGHDAFGGGGFGGGGGGGDESAEVANDDYVKTTGMFYLPSADLWLKRSQNRMFATWSQPRPSGSSKTCRPGREEDVHPRKGGQAAELFVEMPKDKAKRKAVLDLQAKEMGTPPLKDKAEVHRHRVLEPTAASDRFPPLSRFSGRGGVG